MFKLDEKHLEKAKKIVLNHRKKKSCDKCYDRGYIGVNENNLLITCQKCVDVDASMEEWKKYVNDYPELKEYFSDLFEEEGNTEETD
ncbi:MAG: hypothetical protein CSB55_06645 [Candidatus Cloacimonadota bacterium]|nr:MAG: hypothetical protein CSB55_06645 [Candidatus Cloacimonadota bacterium]